MGPRHRPPLGVRVFAGLLGVGVLALNAAVMLSDRAPSFLRRVFGDFAGRLSDRIDAGGRPAQIATDPRLPEGDSLVHIAVWGLAIVMVGLAVWTWRGLAVGGVVVFVASIVVEVAQGRYTDTRVVELDDIVANGVGIVLGSLVVAACYLIWSAVAQAARR